MPSMPTLKVIDGGRATDGRAPSAPPAIAGERLYPIFAAIDRRGAFLHVVAVSLILHGAAIFAAVGWGFFGEERVAGGSEELVIIEGIDVVLLDQVPSPLAEAGPVDESDVVDPAPATEARSMAATSHSETPVAGALLVSGDRVEAVPELVARAVEPDSSLSARLALPGRSAAAAAAAVAVPADDAPARASSDAPRATEPAAVAIASPLEDAPATVASASTIQAEPPETASMPVAAPAEAEPAVDRARPVASETFRAADKRSATLVGVQPIAPEITTATEVVEDEQRQPLTEATVIAAIEIVPEPPIPTPNPLEPVKAEGPAERTAGAASRGASASAAARGPAKANAGAGGASRSTQGKAMLSTYQSRLVAHLRRFRSYPAAARSRRIEGAASVRITIDRSGRVVAVSLAGSTGHGILDREAVAMVRRASPFPPIPSGLGQSQITVRAPIRFDIR
jgi:periplasmic protein TonB